MRKAAAPSLPLVPDEAEQLHLDRIAETVMVAIVGCAPLRSAIVEQCLLVERDPLDHIASFAYDHAVALRAERARRLA